MRDTSVMFRGVCGDAIELAFIRDLGPGRGGGLVRGTKKMLTDLKRRNFSFHTIRCDGASRKSVLHVFMLFLCF
jgi:hypothetical protein